MTQKERLVIVHADLAFALKADEPIDTAYTLANCMLVPQQQLEGSTFDFIDYRLNGVAESSSPVEGYDYENGFKAPRYEVLTAIGNGWENVWTEDDKPVTFASYDEALTEMLEHIADLVEAGMDFNPRDFKIAPVGEGA
jgi:hypothetical protein